MKIKDYEEAIGALECDIVLDEVKLRKGCVHRFFGHKGCTLLMWDDAGRGYSVKLHTVEDGEVTHDTHEGVVESCYERDNVYDLKFE